MGLWWLERPYDMVIAQKSHDQRTMLPLLSLLAEEDAEVLAPGTEWY